MINTQIREGNRLYYDDLNFPQGFNRSGEFSIAESQILNTLGHTLKCLHDGDLKPENDEEKRFVAVTAGKKEPLSLVEKTWCKYLKSVAPKTWHTLNGGLNGKSVSNSSEYDLEL